jgi:hypothetical protein
MAATPYQTTVGINIGDSVTYSVTVANSTIANGDLITTFVPGFTFKVASIQAIVDTAVTTGSKAANFQAAITNTATGVKTNINGALLATTSANLTPVGKVLAASATDPQPLNFGGPTDSFSLTASGVTAYVEGVTTFIVTLTGLG